MQYRIDITGNVSNVRHQRKLKENKSHPIIEKQSSTYIRYAEFHKPLPYDLVRRMEDKVNINKEIIKLEKNQGSIKDKESLFR